MDSVVEYYVLALLRYQVWYSREISKWEMSSFVNMSA